MDPASETPKPDPDDAWFEPDAAEARRLLEERIEGRRASGVQPGSNPEPAREEFLDPELFLNRELSALEFNRRVLEQAKDPTTPLLERLRFLTISISNLDEFFEIRVATHKQRVAFGLSETDADGLTTREVLHAVSASAHQLVDEQYQTLNEILLPALAGEGIELRKRADWDEKVRSWSRRYFSRQVSPVLTPVALDPAHPFPRILNKSLNFIVSLRGSDAFGRDAGTAILQVPRSLPRLIEIPEDVRSAPQEFVLLSAVIRQHIGDVFPGLKVTGCYQFRVTRNSDLWLDEEEVDDLLGALKGELPSRRYGDAVRLEVAMNCTEEMAALLLEKFQLTDEDLYRVNGPVNLHRLVALHSAVDRPDLKYKAFKPGRMHGGEGPPDMFALLREREILLHHPYESFQPILELLRQAAHDPDVLAIKQTVYRTGKNSPVVEALLDAARNGKEITAVIELFARFDEERNIDLATQLQEAGANVVYGIFGYKTHAKMIMIVRREGDRIRRYVHLGTGNYHASTARSYTDLGFLTSDPDLTQDVHRLFNQLTGLGKPAKLKRLIQAPFQLHEALVAHIEDERKAAERGKEARVVAKMNSLVEPRIIRALYHASQAGVQVDLIVRGICCLRPGVPGVSENIRVRSIIGRFLEHSRVFFFHARGERIVYASSADWMPRNFFRRVETCFPIDDEVLKERVIDECLEAPLRDDRQAWILQPDGTYEAARSSGDSLASQQALMEKLGR